MTITITITGDTHQEVLFQLQGLAGAVGQQSAPAGAGTAASAAATSASAPAPKPSRGKKDAPAGNAAGAAAADSSTTTTADSAASANGDPAALTPEQEKAIERGDTVALSQAQVTKIVSDAEKAIDPAKLRTEIRSVLTPLMTSDKAIKVQELIAQFGGSVSKCADEDLAALLAKAKVLA